MSEQHPPTPLRYYRDKAAEIHIAADAMHEPAKSIMLRIAASYDTLASSLTPIDRHIRPPSVKPD